MIASIIHQVEQNLDKIISLYFDHVSLTYPTDTSKITQLGAGENNLNLLVSLNDKNKFVLRIVLDERYKHRIEHEFKIL